MHFIGNLFGSVFSIISSGDVNAYNQVKTTVCNPFCTGTVWAILSFFQLDLYEDVLQSVVLKRSVC